MKTTQTEITIHLLCIDFPGRNFEGKADIKLGPRKGELVVDDVFGSYEAADRSHAEVDGQQRRAALCVGEAGAHRVGLG